MVQHCTNVAFWSSEKFSTANLVTRSCITRRRRHWSVREDGQEITVNSALQTLDLLVCAMTVSRDGLGLTVILVLEAGPALGVLSVPLDGSELTVILVMSTSGLMNNVTHV